MGCIAYENPSMGIYFITDPDGYWIGLRALMNGLYFYPGVASLPLFYRKKLCVVMSGEEKRAMEKPYWEEMCIRDRVCGPSAEAPAGAQKYSN